MLTISFSNKPKHFRLDTTFIERGLPEIIAEQLHDKYTWLITASFISPQKMRALNKRFRSKDTTTDVLSFRYGEETINHDCCPMGEILLSETKIEHQSREHGVRKEEECFHLIIHGILHVLGFDHEKAHDAANMEEHEQAILHTLITRKRES